MNQSVHKEYYPRAATITALRDYGYGRRQVWDLIQSFRKNLDGKEFSCLDTEFYSFARGESEPNLSTPVSLQADTDEEDEVNLEPTDIISFTFTSPSTTMKILVSESCPIPHKPIMTFFACPG